MCIGTGTAIAIAVAAGTTAGAVYSANKGASSARDAATSQTTAANHAADLQSKSAADALEYTKAQAEIARRDADTVQHANYDQWRATQVYNNQTSASRTRNINALGAQYGVAARDIPEMVIPDYRGTVGDAAAGPPAATGPVSQGSTPAAPYGSTPVPTPAATPAATTPSAGLPSTTAPGATTPAYLPPGIRIDRESLTQQITASVQRMAGRDPTPAEIEWGIHYASKPDIYRDRLTRIGWNDYLATRLVTGSDSADVRLAGYAGVIPGGVPGLGGTGAGTVGSAMRGPAAASSTAPASSALATPPINPALTVDPYQRRTVRDYFAA